MNWPLKMAFAYILDRRREKWISISALLASGGLFLGVTTLIIVLSVMQGFRDTMLDKILQIQGHVNVYGQITEHEKLEQHLLKIPHITNTIRVLEKQFMAIHNKQAFGVLAHGLETKSICAKLKGRILSGAIDSLNSENTIAIGAKLAEETGMKVGDSITIMSADSISTPFGNAPRMQQFKVGAIFSLGMYQYDKLLCILKLDNMQSFLDMEGSVSNILLFLDRSERAQEIAKQLQKDQVLKDTHISSWQENNITFAQVLTVQRNVMFIVISLMIIIASFNGISSLLMLVKEKSKELAILRVLGASKWQVTKIFLYIGSFIGAVSVCAGVLFGIILSINLDRIRQLVEKLFGLNLFPEDFYHLSSIPVHIEWSQIGLVSLWCFLLAILAIVYPCLKVLKIEPDKELKMS